MLYMMNMFEQWSE
uniref:Uncharacterized protein n=1 Tax=Arundo donax TaxID=35708 RepID=A0A0A9GPB2_ARUDO